MENQPSTIVPQPPVQTQPSVSEAKLGVSRRKLLALQSFTTVIFIALGVSIFLWKPWLPNIKAAERYVTVTGTATLKAYPDSYSFTAFLDASAQSKTTAQQVVNNQKLLLFNDLKSLGVDTSQIKSEDMSPGLPGLPFTEYTESESLIVHNVTIAKKVYGYFVDNPQYGVYDPSITYSQAAQKQLQGQALSVATSDANSKADALAQKMGLKVDRVKSIDEKGFNGNGSCSTDQLCNAADTLEPFLVTSEYSKLPNDETLSYGVAVTYYVH